MSLDFGLKGVHTLVTGASGGIGIEIVRTFLALGACVTAQYNENIGDLSLLQSDPHLKCIQADVRRDGSSELFETAQHTHGSVAILIANHGISPPENVAIADMDPHRWQKTIDINLTGTFLLSQAYLRQLRDAPDDTKDLANIVFVGSTAGHFGEAFHADYAASKSGIMYGLTNSLKNEIVHIAPKGRVNVVNPGWTATPKKQEKLGDEAFLGKVLATVPLNKVATPEDIARQIAVLASPVLSGHVSGQNVFVAGGMEGRVLN